MGVLFSHQTKDGNVVMYDKQGLYFTVSYDLETYGRGQFKFRNVMNAREKYIEIRQRLFN